MVLLGWVGFLTAPSTHLGTVPILALPRAAPRGLKQEVLDHVAC